MIYEHENVRVWASLLDSNTLDQAMRAARSPAVIMPLDLMPDAHLGKGATVGSVIVTENTIMPAAVGVDIGCGMVALETTLTANDLPQSLDGFMPEVVRSIPAGVGHGHSSVSDVAAMWFNTNSNPRLSDNLRDTAAKQFGSLGSGNHFFEVCLDERDVVWLVLHSGSRGVGNKLAEGHIKVARALEQDVEDKDLAYFVQGTEEFDAYIKDMLWSQAYAAANRARMIDSVSQAFLRWVGHGDYVQMINCHHNYSEQDSIDGRTVWVTRKGAINAEQGALGVIPGSMGAASYIVEGKGNPLAYKSAPHGAGRRLSRGAAKRELTVENLKTQMRGKTWLEDQAQALLDESPDAYKSIDTVMNDSSDLVEVQHVLHQILNYKGL